MSILIEAIKKIYKELDNEIEFTFPSDFPAFKGHFPDYPLLPAVVQIELALYALSRRLNKKVILKSIKKSKFVAPIFPNETIKMQITNKPEYVEVVITKNNQTVSTLQLVIG